MDFYSAYRHGFVRVAACTHHTTLADPAANAESVLRLARDCHDDSVALAVFPELTLSGYSIEDILLQDALLDAVEVALLDIVVASAELMPVLVVGAPLRYQHRIYNTAVVIHRGEVRGVVPKSYRPTCLASYCTSRSARTCSCRFRRARRRRWRARRCWPTCPEARSRSGGQKTGRCWPAPRRRGAWPPTSTPRRGRANPPPIWRGTARRWCGRTACAWPHRSGSRRVSAGRSPTSTSSCCVRSGCEWAPSTTIASTIGSLRSPSGGWNSGSIRPRVTSGCAVRSSGSHSCRRIPHGWNMIAMRPTTSRSPVWSSGC